jgi:hypothetical protein
MLYWSGYGRRYRMVSGRMFECGPGAGDQPLVTKATTA